MTSFQREKCCVIVLNCNGRDLLLACLKSLAAQIRSSFEAVVVDNGSSDGSLEMIALEFPAIRVISLPENQGFCIANNIAMRDALTRGFEEILLLNNDTILHPSCVAELQAALRREQAVAAVCPKIYFASDPDHFWYAGGDFSRWSARLIQRGWRQKDRGQFDRRVEVEVVTGCAVLLRASALRDAGLLDESLWAYLEDVEWSIRFRRCGYGLRLAPQARLWHHDGATWVRVLGGGSAAKRQFLSTRNLLWLIRKHAQVKQLPTCLLGFLFYHVMFYSALRVACGDWRALWSIYRGVGSGLRLHSNQTNPGQMGRESIEGGV